MGIAETDIDHLSDALDGGARLIDVREPDEYRDGHVPGAVLVPLATVPDQLEQFRGDGPTYVICRSGGRSMQACEIAADHGIDVVNVSGGTLAWATSGRPITAGDEPA